MQGTVKAIVDMGKGVQAPLMRKLVAANQNAPMPKRAIDDPQWYDIKQMVEIMFDARARVRDAIAERRNAETVHIRYNGHPSRQLITAEIHGINMQIALHWHTYRQSASAYHTAWAVYQENLKH